MANYLEIFEGLNDLSTQQLHDLNAELVAIMRERRSTESRKAIRNLVIGQTVVWKGRPARGLTPDVTRGTIMDVRKTKAVVEWARRGGIAVTLLCPANLLEIVE